MEQSLCIFIKRVHCTNFLLFSPSFSLVKHDGKWFQVGLRLFSFFFNLWFYSPPTDTPNVTMLYMGVHNNLYTLKKCEKGIYTNSNNNYNWFYANTNTEKKNTLANTFFSNHFLTEQKWKVLVGDRKQKEFVKTSFEILNVSFLNKIPNIIPSTFLASNTFTSNENRYAHGYASKEQSFWILFFRTAENRRKKIAKGSC